MPEDRTDLMLEILKKIQAEFSDFRREQNSQGTRMLSMEDHQRGIITSLHGVTTSIHGVQEDISSLKHRVDQIEKRLGLRDTEH